MICHNCHQRGHKSKDCMQAVICNNCGGRGHLAVECPSTPMVTRGPRRR
jgi:cellular nucleic acid-binding protein